jgi:hypothetical protein
MVAAVSGKGGLIFKDPIRNQLAGDVSELGVVEGLKHEILSSNPSTLKRRVAGCRWLTPVTLATQEAEVRRRMI